MTRVARLGLFVLVAVISFAAFVFLVGEKQLLFSNTYRLNAAFNTVAGLQEGAEVRLGGVRVGTVSSIHMPPRLGVKVKVNMVLNTETLHLLKQDSIASIKTEGLVGSKYVSISYGSPNAPAVYNEYTIEGAPPVDVAQIMAKADRILGTADNALKSLDATSSNLKSISDKINSGQGTLGALINDRGLYEQLNQTLGEADSALRSVDQVAANARDITEKINAGEGTLGALVNDKTMYRNLNETAANAVAISQDIRARAPSVLQNTDEVLSTANATLKNIDAASANVKSITAKIDAGEGTLGALVNNSNLSENLSNTLTNINEITQQAKSGVTGFSENMEALKHNFLFHSFFRKRGYMDAAETNTQQIAQLPQSPPSSEFVIDAGKLFEKRDTAKLEHPGKLDAAGQYLESHPFDLAVVTAYTDMKGDSGQDLKLSQARAYVARKYLVDHFRLRDARIKTRGLGKQEPLIMKPENGVEVLIFQNAAPQPAAPPTKRRK